MKKQASQTKRVIVTGATSVIGQPVLRQLRASGACVLEVSRQSYVSDNAVLAWDLQSTNTGWKQSLQTSLQQSIEDSNEKMAEGSSEKSTVGSDSKAAEGSGKAKTDVDLTNGLSLVHCAPIWLLARHLEALIELGVNRIIAFSSSSIDGKANSTSASEQNIVRLLTEAEQQVSDICQRHQVALSIFRPTMIYGYGQGQNLSFIARVIKRCGLFVIANPANGLRQPVHADDLAQAVAQALYAPASYGRTYTLSGAETMTYKELVQRVFTALGVRPRIIGLNLSLYRLGLKSVSRMAKLLGKSLPIDPAMADRMQQDLSFSHQAAVQDFGYAPGTFLPNAAADLLADEQGDFATGKLANKLNDDLNDDNDRQGVQ